MTSTRILPLLLGAAVLATAAPVAHAAPKPKHTFTYTFELEGKQTTTWTFEHEAAGDCDASQSGSGSETIRFHGRAGKVVSYDGFKEPPFVSKDGMGSKLRLRGTVARQGAITSGPASGADDCADGTGDGTPEAPDCGTRALSGIMVEPTYESGKARIHLEQDNAAVVPDFGSCPVFGGSYPYLLADVHGKPVDQELPYADLFEQGKNILLATGVDRGSDGEAQWTTRIRWTLSITRVKRERIG